MSIRFPLSLLTLLLASVLHPSPLWSSPESERAATDALRAALPDPTPAIAYDYVGDLVLGGLWAGETRYTAKVAKVGRQSVWRVTEDTYIDHAGAETRIRLLAHLKPDLSILSGTYTRSEKEVTTTLAFSRGGSGLLVQRRVERKGADPASDLVQLAIDPGATTGIGALLLFLRAGPQKGKPAYRLPWISNETFDALDPDVRPPDLTMRVEGAGTLTVGNTEHKAWTVSCTAGANTFTCALAPDRRSLLGMRNAAAAVDVVPRGEGGERLSVQADEPARTWKDAFLKFGFGYHLPRRTLLQAAFHWEDMYEYETKVLKRWDAGRPLSEFQAAWVEEFVQQSKNRSVQDARRLLSMTLGTGTLTHKGEDAVVFAAHANFGGGVQRTYYLSKKDGVWGITRIEF
jgi:hypothetical protein